MTDVDTEYNVVLLHRRPDLLKQCCKLLNSEWPRSDTARLKFLKQSCDAFPTCLVLVDKNDKVVGHCKIFLIPWISHSCYFQSVIIHYEYRSQGLGSKLLRSAEEYIIRKGLKNIYLMTKGQELFYFKNGYDICDPFKAHSINEIISPTTLKRGKSREKNNQSSGPPPPPPMPAVQIPKVFDLNVQLKTHMVKKL